MNQLVNNKKHGNWTSYYQRLKNDSSHISRVSYICTYHKGIPIGYEEDYLLTPNKVFRKQYYII